MTLKKLTNDHYIIIDDSEIVKGDMLYLLYGNIPFTKQGCIGKCEFPDSNYLGAVWKKITHSTRPESLGMCWMQSVQPLLLSEVKELIGEVDVEKKAYLAAQKKFKLEHIPLEQVDEYGGVIKEFVQNFINTYNQALEDNKNNKYTEQDMRRYHNIMCLYGNKKGEEFIHSLQPKTEWEVEFIDGKLTLKK